MVASNFRCEFQEHITDRILSRLCEAADLVATNLTANRLRLRELLDDLAFELDAGDLAMDTLNHKESSQASSAEPIGLVCESARNRF